MTYHIEILKEAEEEKYNNFLKERSYLIEHTLPWGKVLKDTFNFEPIHVIAKNGEGQIKAVLPLFETNSLLFGRRIVSTPHAVYVGLISDDEASKKIIEYAIDIAKERGVKYLEIRNEKDIPNLMNNEFQRRGGITNFGLNLSKNIEDIWVKLPKACRASVKKAYKYGLVVKKDNSQALDVFYNLFLSTRKFRGIPAYPYNMFKSILNNLKDETKIYSVEYNGQTVLSAIFFFYNKRIRYAYVGVIHENYITQMRPYHILLWEAIKDGCEQGYEIMNLGGAAKFTNDGGLYSFKEKWADNAVDISSYFYLNKTKEVPPLCYDSKSLRLIGKIWSKMPLPILKAISPFAVKQFI